MKSIWYNVEHVRGVLGGAVVTSISNDVSLWGAFEWSATPQGFKHWSDITHGRKKLSKRSRQYLNKLLAHNPK